MMLGGNDTRHIPLGDSGTAAIVVSVLYMIGAAAIIANWQKTGFHYYKALITSTAREFPYTPPLQQADWCVSTPLPSLRARTTSQQKRSAMS